jgi:hypothetical protein
VPVMSIPRYPHTSGGGAQSSHCPRPSPDRERHVARGGRTSSGDARTSGERWQFLTAEPVTSACVCIPPVNAVPEKRVANRAGRLTLLAPHPGRTSFGDYHRFEGCPKEHSSGNG